MSRVHITRLQAHDSSIDVRWTSFGDRWIASADTPDGPTMGVGWTPIEALTNALEPFDVADGEALDVIADGMPDGLH